ncbi:hypothetical protein BS50DRAFT_597922 [Corynespora cassiicola Philippines]|uniref:DUF1640-domain-containing protein n=1 Tax=Corynespora cassiicola Philippines TaxID=1448308 RepID=A0A2T2NZ09_CORCC|nr:hypothetical protein BS50DRAFT_597922 [Corynespora cassiicola Philippines]
MATPRLPFLWPMLFRPMHASPATSRAIQRSRHRATRVSRGFATTTHLSQGPVNQRYGTAQEPAPHLREQGVQNNDPATSKSEPAKLPDTPEEEDEEEPPHPTSAPPRKKTEDITDPPPSDTVPEPPKMPDARPLDTVLHMPSPQEEEQRRPPHLKTPPYVHHFDTYGLVRGLTTSGFSQEQSVTIMKALRGILTDNMELARKGLVSKSNVENETYLFRAACSELRTEIGNSRKGEMERLRSERNQLQHEVDLVNQKMNQETAHLKDELKGLFDDRKMAVRQEQRTMESKIQELNNKITVELNSDARSKVEGLRWILTQRAAIAVSLSAFMLFISLRYSSHVSHQQSEKKKAEEKKTPPPPSEEDDGSPKAPKMMTTNMHNDALGGEILASEGGVSLG